MVNFSRQGAESGGIKVECNYSRSWWWLQKATNVSKIFGFYISNGWVTCELHVNKVKELVSLIFSRQGAYSRLQFYVVYIMGDLTKKKYIRCLKNACCRKQKAWLLRKTPCISALAFLCWPAYQKCSWWTIVFDEKNHKSQITQFPNLLGTEKFIHKNWTSISLSDENHLHRAPSSLLLCATIVDVFMTFLGLCIPVALSNLEFMCALPFTRMLASTLGTLKTDEHVNVCLGPIWVISAVPPILLICFNLADKYHLNPIDLFFLLSWWIFLPAWSFTMHCWSSPSDYLTTADSFKLWGKKTL